MSDSQQGTQQAGQVEQAGQPGQVGQTDRPAQSVHPGQSDLANRAARPGQPNQPGQSSPSGQAGDGKKKFGDKGAKVYILCGVLSTFVLCSLLTDVVCAIFGLILDLPISLLNRLLLTSTLGAGGVQLLNDYASFLGMALSFLLILYLVKPWRPYLKAYGTGPSGNRVSMLAIGLLIGFVMNGVSILAAVLAGSVQLDFVQFNVIGFVLFLIFIFIQASTEEIICRGFAYQRIKRTYGTAAAVIGSALIFSLAHIMNPGVTPLALLDIFLTGVLYALMVRYCDSIWMAMGAHTAWNLTQNILFGLPNSGMASSYSFFGLSGVASNSFAYDTAFGVEGTIFAVGVNAVCCLALYLWGRSRGKKRDFDIWKGSALEASQQEFAAASAVGAAGAAGDASAAGTAGAAGAEGVAGAAGATGVAGAAAAAAPVGAAGAEGGPNASATATATSTAASAPQAAAPQAAAPKKRWFY